MGSMDMDRPDSDVESDDAAFVEDDDEVLGDLTGEQGDEDISPDLSDAGDGEGPNVEDTSLQTFEGHTDSVYAVAWNAVHQDLVASGGGDDKAYLWQDGDPEHVIELAGHTDTVASASFSSSGELLATGSLDGTVRIWDVHSGRCMVTLEGPAEAVNWICWHPSGNVLLAGSEDFTCWMWNAVSGACMQVFTGHSGSVQCGAFTPDGKTVVTGGGDGDASIRVWNPKSGQCTTHIAGPGFHEAGLTSLDLTADSSACVSGAEDGSVCVTHLASGRILANLAGHSDSVEAIRIWPQPFLFATASVDGKLLVWDGAKLILRETCEHPEAVVSLQLHPTQPWAITGALDGVLRVWDLRTGELVRTRSGHTNGIQELAVSPSGSLVLTGSDDHTCKVFDIVA